MAAARSSLRPRRPAGVVPEDGDRRDGL